jgi:hypothetical protein
VTLSERVVALHRALAQRRVPHAFGGAIALAYWTLEPRGTRDIDLNLFVPIAKAEPALRALPGGIAQPTATGETIRREGQARLWWDDAPIDLFFSYEPIHDDAARNRRTVPFAGVRIPVLGPVELAIFKVIFDRTQDWADIEAMLAADTVDAAVVRAALRTLFDDDDPRFARLADAERRARR